MSAMARRVIRSLDGCDLRNRFNSYKDGVRICDLHSLVGLHNGFYCNYEEKVEVALYWCSVMRQHFPKDILMVNLGGYPPHGFNTTVTDEVPY